MTEEERKSLGRLIEAEIEELKKNIVGMEESVKPVSPDNAIGRLSRMDAIAGRMVCEATLGSLKSRFSKLQYLARRIDHPEFGICTMCGDPIPVRRLMVIPESSRCVHCAD